MLEKLGDRPSDQIFQSHLSQGLQWYMSGQYSFSLLEFSQAALENPSSAEVHYDLALTRYRLNQVEKSKAEIRQCLLLCDHYGEARDFLRLIENNLSPDSAEAYLNRGVGGNLTYDPFSQETRGRSLPSPSLIDNPVLFGSVKTMTGNTQIWGGPTSLLAAPYDSSGEINTQLGLASRDNDFKGCLYASTGLSRRNGGGTDGWDDMKTLGASCDPPLGRNFSLYSGYDWQQETLKGQEVYQHHQVTTAILYQIAEFKLQAQAQCLLESDRQNTDMDSWSWVATFQGNRTLGRDLTLQFTYSRRWNSALVAKYDYVSDGFLLTFQKSGWSQWNLDLGVGIQTLSYPHYPLMERTVPMRSDLVSLIYAEFRHPLLDKIFVIAGDNFEMESSNAESSAPCSNRIYTGLQLFL